MTLLDCDANLEIFSFSAFFSFRVTAQKRVHGPVAVQPQWRNLAEEGFRMSFAGTLTCHDHLLQEHRT